MHAYWIVLFFLLGIVFGSLFNVIGFRVPKNLSFVKGYSHCPTCRERLRWVELLPVVSYFFQQGKCRHCKCQISKIYPLVELFTGLLFAYSYMTIGFQLELITVLFLISMLMIIVVSDIAYMLIPDKVLLFFLPFFVLLRLLSPLEPWYNSLIGSATGFILIAIIILVSKGGMGAGDMKLFGVLGFILGLGNVLLTFFMAALLGAVIGGILQVIGKVGRKQPIPFGPYIVVATFFCYFYGDEIIHWYLSFV